MEEYFLKKITNELGYEIDFGDDGTMTETLRAERYRDSYGFHSIRISIGSQKIEVTSDKYSEHTEQLLRKFISVIEPVLDNRCEIDENH